MQADLQEIYKSYGRVQANAGVSLGLEPGRIYGLLGENGAGKSTLMRILAGHTRPDRGRILFEGRPAGRLDPARALALGVGMLYQDPLDFPALRVWESFQAGGPRRSRRETFRRLLDLAGRFDFQFFPETPVNELTVGERQQLEILRLLDAGVRLLILDEPTTGISITQKEKLFAALRELSVEVGRIIILVTHKLAEATGLCDEIFILRQGRLAGCFTPPYETGEILSSMFGPEAVRETAGRGRPEPRPEMGLELVNARFAGEKFDLAGVSLSARAGEIIGLAGLEGNGQELLLRGLAGLVRMTSGRLVFRRVELGGRSYLHFRRESIHFLPAARLEEGLFPDLSLTEHVCLTHPGRKSQVLDFFREVCVKKYRLAAEPSTSARALSGGNQQRLLLSLIPSGTALLLMEHPTRGLDVGSAHQVWSNLEERCRRGATLFFSSADLDEIIEHSHRVLVFYDRRLVADLPARETTQDLISGLMAGRERAA
ncbi:MAG: ATP-binding cassette domain-containing protein [Thermodesulfobacteriota bacterium]